MSDWPNLQRGPASPVRGYGPRSMPIAIPPGFAPSPQQQQQQQQQQPPQSHSPPNMLGSGPESFEDAYMDPAAYGYYAAAHSYASPPQPSSPVKHPGAFFPQQYAQQQPPQPPRGLYDYGPYGAASQVQVQIQQQSPPMHQSPPVADDFPALPGYAPQQKRDETTAAAAAAAAQQPQSHPTKSPPPKDMSELANAAQFIPKNFVFKQPAAVTAQKFPATAAAAAVPTMRPAASGSPTPTSVPMYQQQQQPQPIPQMRMGTSPVQSQQQPLQQQQQQQTGKVVSDKYGMLGLLSVIRMTNPDLNALSLGIDLTSLGLDLNSTDCLHATFVSPFAREATKAEPEYHMPVCYLMQPQLQRPDQKVSLFSEETLFYIFYTMPRDELQLAAARALIRAEWMFHRELRVWIKRVQGVEPSAKTADYERGSFNVFDVNAWEIVRKDNWVVFYSDLEISLPSA